MKIFPRIFVAEKIREFKLKIRNFSVLNMSELNNLISITVVAAAARRVHEQGYSYHRAESYRMSNLHVLFLNRELI